VYVGKPAQLIQKVYLTPKYTIILIGIMHCIVLMLLLQQTFYIVQICGFPYCLFWSLELESEQLALLSIVTITKAKVDVVSNHWVCMYSCKCAHVFMWEWSRGWHKYAYVRFHVQLHIMFTLPINENKWLIILWFFSTSFTICATIRR